MKDVGKIENIDSYRDGGSIGIETNKGLYFWINNKAIECINTDRGKLYIGNINNTSEEIFDVELINSLLERLCEYERRHKYKIIAAQEAIKQIEVKI